MIGEWIILIDQYGIPLAGLGVVSWLWWQERKRGDSLQDRLYERSERDIREAIEREIQMHTMLERILEFVKVRN